MELAFHLPIIPVDFIANVHLALQETFAKQVSFMVLPKILLLSKFKP